MERNKGTTSITFHLRRLYNSFGLNGRIGHKPVITLGKNIHLVISQISMTFITGKSTNTWKLLEIWVSV
jgi:hypothetical protein